MPPVLKKRGGPKVSSPAPDSCPTTGKVVAKPCDLRGGQRQKRSDVGWTGLKTQIPTTSPQPAIVLQRKRQASPRGHYSQAKNIEKGKREARRGRPLRAEVQPQRSGRVTFSWSTIGNFHSSTSIEDEVDESPSIPPVVFRPELVTAHCFKRLKKKDFHLPQSRRRIIIVCGTKDQAPVNPMLPPQKPPSPIPTFKTLQIEDIQQPPLDQKAWLSQRAKLRQELESFGDIKRWLENKPSITPSEAKVLNMIHQEQKPHKDNLTVTRVVYKPKVPRSHNPPPHLQLPRPVALWDMYSYLCSRKIKILEIFNKMEQGDNQPIPREEFILALKAIGVPLKNQELEDIVIYLSSLGRKNAITTDALASTHKQWLLSQQRSSVFSSKEYYSWMKQKASPKSPPKKQQPKELAPQLPKKDLLEVPEVDLMESRPMTLEDMEDVGKRYRETRREHKFPYSSIPYMESCRVVRCGNKYYDDHCLPSTLQGEMQELVNLTRRDNFLVYLQCWELCEAFGLPLTEDILMRALLYPGDKLISLKDEIRPIRQPGGYYVDEKLVHILPGLDLQMRQKLEAKKTDKLGFRPAFSLPLSCCCPFKLQALGCWHAVSCCPHLTSHLRLASPKCHPSTCLRIRGLPQLPQNYPPDHRLIPSESHARRWHP